MYYTNRNTTKYSNTALTKEEADQYIQSISPPKDLICPITLTLFQEPVLALGDGYTYEKQSIVTWFHSQQSRSSHGHVRSPVTNAYMDISAMEQDHHDNHTSNNNNNNNNNNINNNNINNAHNRYSLKLIPNKIVADMTRHFKEQLGIELCHRVQAFVISGMLEDDGFRITSLIEMGADLTIRIKTTQSATDTTTTTSRNHNASQKMVNGDSAFMACIRMQHLSLCQVFVHHHVPVISIVNHNGETCIDVLNTILSSSSIMQRNESRATWNDLLAQLEKKASMEREEIIKLEQQRQVLNQRQRQRQETLAQESRTMANNNRHILSSSSPLSSVMQNGLGSLEEGYGYFPSLIALQFQNHIPSPPATFAQIEHDEKSRLYTILKSTTILVFMIWILG
jgi:hypothetical protein